MTLRRLLTSVALGLAVPLALSAQQATVVTGTVRTRTSEPVRGAYVAIPELNLATVTNDVGTYRLVVPAGAATASATLHVQSIGYRNVEVPLRLEGGSVQQDVTMTEQAVQLEQVVVTGTAGRQQVRAQAAKVEKLDAARITQVAPIVNVQNMLQARVPGVTIYQGSGSSGTAAKIRIRGVSSISLSNDPLIFIDGVRADSRSGDTNTNGAQIYSVLGQGVSRLNDLNPDDIESIEVVKGPAAATLYGADASAGVVNIITKRGRSGGGFSQNIAVEYGRLTTNFTPPANYAVCSGSAMAHKICQGKAEGTIVSDNPLERYDVFNPGNTKQLSWQLRGGTEKYSMFVSAQTEREQGTVPNNSFSRTAFRTNADFFPANNVRIETGFGLMRTKTRLPNSDNSIYGFVAGGMLGNALSVGEAADGWYAGFGQKEGRASLQNIDDAWRFEPRVALNWTPTSRITQRLIVGGDLTRTNATVFYPKNDLAWFGSDQLNSGQIQQARENNDHWTIDYLGSGYLDLSPSVRADLSVGLQTIIYDDDVILTTGTGLVANPANSIGAASQRSSDERIAKNRSNGFFGQLQLSFWDRLYLKGAARLDRNSAFGTESKYFLSPSVGASYVISEEGFWKDGGLGRIFPTMRLRASFGQTGRSPTDGALALFNPTPYATLDGATHPGVVPYDPGNSKLKPERGSELEAGFEAAALNDRLGIDLTYFDKTTTDAILRRPISPSLGFSQNPYVNIGKIVNRGLELALTGRILTLENVGLESRLSINTLHNEVVSLGGIAPYGTLNRVAEGMPVNGFAAYRILELRDTIAVVDTALTLVGNVVPGIEGTFGTTLNLFKRITLYGQLDYHGDVKRYNGSGQFRERQFRNDANFVIPDKLSKEERLRRFGPFIDLNGNPVAFGSVNEAYIEDGSFLKLREVSLSYRLPTSLLGRLSMQDATLTVSARNLATWTKFTGLDPETVYGENQEFFTIPAERRILVRLNVRY